MADTEKTGGKSAAKKKDMVRTMESKSLHTTKNTDKPITYELTRKAVKNINIRVKPDGRVMVSANRNVPIKYIEELLAGHQEFIYKALDKYQKRRKDLPPQDREYVNGERFKILGESLCLEVITGNAESVCLDNGRIYMQVREACGAEHRKKLFMDWLKAYRQEVFTEIVNQEYEKYKKYGIKYPQIKIRNMTSRWGSCQTVKGVVTLNAKLIEAPQACIEYVVVHELTHLLYPNHSKDFWNFVTMMMPDWKERKRALDNIF